jgi:hypothetical protein
MESSMGERFVVAGLVPPPVGRWLSCDWSECPDQETVLRLNSRRRFW